MARKKFTLDVDGNNPQGPGPGPGPGHELTPPNRQMDTLEFENMLAQGRLTTVGYIYQGEFASPVAADTQSETDAEDVEPLTVNCIVVYVGGTAYKICT